MDCEAGMEQFINEAVALLIGIVTIAKILLGAIFLFADQTPGAAVFWLVILLWGIIDVLFFFGSTLHSLTQASAA